MQTFISPLGFDTSHILALTNRYGIKKEDQIYLLQSDNEEIRAKNAFEDIKNVISKLEKNIKIEKVILNHRDFQSMVFKIFDIINDSSKSGIHETPVIINLSGGPREILVALTTSANILSNKIAHCTQYSDIDRELREIKIPFAKKQNEDSYKVINLIQNNNNSVSLGEIALQLQFSESKVSRICARLNAEGYITTKKIGKTKMAEVTFSGKLAIKL